MNKAIFESLLKKPPDNEKQSHIFIVGSQQLAENIGLSGFIPVLVRNADGYVRNVGELQEIITGMLYGNHVEDYTFVPALNRKDNESLQRFFEDESLSYRDDGWKLFRKAYMCRPGADEQVGKAISRYINSYQIPKDADAAPDDDESILDTLIRLDVQKRYQMNDKSRGRLFSAVFKNKHRYNPLMKDYMFYDGKRWQKDTESIKARESAQKLSDEMIKYAVNVVEDDENRSYLKAVSKMASRTVRETMIADARVNNPISTEELDQDDYLLNVQNGTLDISGDKPVFKQHNPDDLLSKVCNVSYDPNAKCPEWEKFLSEIMMDDAEKIRYLQKIAGLSLTGNTEQESCFILYGSTTRNGKSTFCESLIYMLGDYALSMKPETLAQKQNNDSRSPSGDIARLAGARFVNASEPPKRMLFDTALLKTLLGRDSIVARHLHEREFQFVPKFKLMINTNFLPTITDDTVFSSGRINVVSFDRHFSEDEQDKKLKNRLRKPKELSGILNWCLEGLRLYRLEGLKRPEAVKQATESYRQDSDKVGNFISECLTRSERNSKAGDIYKAYSDWCDDNGFGCENKQNFFSEMKAKGLFASSGTVGGKSYRNIIRGYVVNDSFEPVDSGDNPFI